MQRLFVVLCLLLALPLGARPALKGTQLSVALRSSDLGAARQGLQDLVTELGGAVVNTSLHPEGGTAQLKVPAAQVSTFLTKVRGLGTVEDEQQSIVDHTQESTELLARVERLEKLAALEWVPQGGNLTPEERAAFVGEFKTCVKERVAADRKTLTGYEQSGQWADVNVTLHAPSAEKRGPIWLVLPSVCMGMALAYFIFGRRPRQPGSKD